MTYDASWHVRHGAVTDSSAYSCLCRFREVLEFSSVLDVGCGDGRWLSQALDLGASTAVGVDGEWTDRATLLFDAADFVGRDLSRPINLNRRFDCVLSLEVAEHLPPESADIFVDNLVLHGDVIIFSAAIPHQGGYRHTNERWQSYWADLFDARGYSVFDLFRRDIWDRDDIHFWYKQNMLLYVSRGREDLITRIRSFIDESRITELPLDIVAPEKYEKIASYQQIAFRPLLRQLPPQAGRKAFALLFRRG